MRMSRSTNQTTDNNLNPPLASLMKSGKTKVLREPVSKQELTTREKIILLESSKLHGCVFPPWKLAPEPFEFELPIGQAQHVDGVDFSLSSLQAETFDGWRRPSEIRPSRVATEQTSKATSRTYDLVQDVITDCSVVASLCAITARTESDHPDILISSVYPYDHESQEPAVSRNGKYVFRFHFNGCYRKVTIDDRLPTSRTSRALHVVDRNDNGIFWPALIEKAYLKLRGGYDFPGSNSGTDLWILTGWIPEQLFLQSDDMDRDALWRRILRAFNYGDVLITMGTGRLTETEERGLGLVGEHDYAVVGVEEFRGQQLFLVKNPWSNGQVWKGHIRYQTPVPSVDEQLHTLRLKEEPSSDRFNREALAPGTFWMPLNDVFQSFESIYLNWNPGLFSCRENIHFRWDLSESGSPDACLGSNPQYSIRSRTSGVVWLLLSRHFISQRQKSMEPVQGPSNTTKTDQGFISLYAFKKDGQRVILSDGAVAHGPYVDSPNALLKVELLSGEALTIVVSEQTLPRAILSFSLSAFSFTPLELAPSLEKYHHTYQLNSAWTAATSGGNAGSPLYHNNPQYSIELAETSDISLLLRTTTAELSVHVSLVWANGKPVQSVTTRDVVGGSGEYRKGFAFAELHEVQGGAYTVVCSTFEKGQIGNFTLSVGSMTACEVGRVHLANAGRFVTKVPTAIWSPRTDRLLAPLMTRRLNRLALKAKSSGSLIAAANHYQSPLKISIELGQGSTTQTLAVSGEDNFGDARHLAVCTPDVDILPEMCARGLWIALDRLGSSGISHDESVEMQILSDGPVEVGAWLSGEHYE